MLLLGVDPRDPFACGPTCVQTCAEMFIAAYLVQCKHPSSANNLNPPVDRWMTDKLGHIYTME